MAGGLFRDSLTQICQELQSPHIPLFIPCPNARHGVGITLDKYIPARSCVSDVHLAMYAFIGMLMLGLRDYSDIGMCLSKR